MMWWPRHLRRVEPSLDAAAAVEQATRALTDAQMFDVRVDQVARDAAEIRRLNHIALAVARSIRGD